VRVLSLPLNLDPCDFLLKEGADAFRELVKSALDPLAFALERSAARFDVGSIEGSRRAAEWVLEVLSKVPARQRMGMDLKLAKSLDALAHRLSLPVEPLKRRLGELRRAVALRTNRENGRSGLAGTGTISQSGSRVGVAVTTTPTSEQDPGTLAPIRLVELDPVDRELIQIVLNEPSAISSLVSRIAVSSLRDAPLRAILQACYDLHGQGQATQAEDIILRLDDSRVRALAAGLLLPMDPNPLPDDVRPASWQERLKGVLGTLAERERQSRLRDLRRALDETDEAVDPVTFRALQVEYRRLMTQRPDTKKDAS
jgi:DNA primase